MKYRRICKSCGALHECRDARGDDCRCPECGGELAGPVAPVPETREERLQVLASPLYQAVLAGRSGPIPSAW